MSNKGDIEEFPCRPGVGWLFSGSEVGIVVFCICIGVDTGKVVGIGVLPSSRPEQDRVRVATTAKQNTDRIMGFLLYTEAGRDRAGTCERSEGSLRAWILTVLYLYLQSAAAST